MEITLVVVEGKTSKNSVKVPLPAVVGRSRQATLTINHNKISREHCELREHEGAVLVRDKGSLNGTFVNGQPVKESLIMPGEKLGVGPLTFLVLYETAAQDIKLRLNGGGTVGEPAPRGVIAPPNSETENQPPEALAEVAGPSLGVEVREPAPSVDYASSLLPPEVESPPPAGDRLPDTDLAAPKVAALAEPSAAGAEPASADSKNAEQPVEEPSPDDDAALRAFLRELGRHGR